MTTKKTQPIETGKLHQTPVNKSKVNPEVNRLLEKCFRRLFRELVRTDEDRDIFGDVVLSMTYKYKGKNFLSEFKEEFRSHKFRLQKAKHLNSYFFSSYDTVSLRLERRCAVELEE